MYKKNDTEDFVAVSNVLPVDTAITDEGDDLVTDIIEVEPINLAEDKEGNIRNERGWKLIATISIISFAIIITAFWVLNYFRY
jgi:hypothetical protein